LASRKDQDEMENPKPFVATSGGKRLDAEQAANDAAAAAARAFEADGSPQSEEIQKLAKEKEELKDTLVRRQADFDNYRKRVEKERHHERHRGAELVVEGLLPVLDALDRALAAHDDPAYAEYKKGFELIRRQLWDLLAKQGVKRIEAAGQQFNPHLHHAVESVQTTDREEGTVVSEMQPGYMFHDRVLRPAMVSVATGKES
jgi:molecular chaperone GrpE